MLSYVPRLIRAFLEDPNKWDIEEATLYDEEGEGAPHEPPLMERFAVKEDNKRMFGGKMMEPMVSGTTGVIKTNRPIEIGEPKHQLFIPKRNQITHELEYRTLGKPSPGEGYCVGIDFFSDYLLLNGQKIEAKTNTTPKKASPAMKRKATADRANKRVSDGLRMLDDFRKKISANDTQEEQKRNLNVMFDNLQELLGNVGSALTEIIDGPAKETTEKKRKANGQSATDGADDDDDQGEDQDQQKKKKKKKD
jgi:hypothetical protein